MSFPAYVAFAWEPGVNQVRWKVYMHFVHGLKGTGEGCLHFTQPRPVKMWGLGHTLHIHQDTAYDCVTWLAARGFIREGARVAGSARGKRMLGVRQFTLEFSVEREAAA